VARSQHDARVRAEFARQADSFASSRTLDSQDLTDPIRAALGPAASGRILDLAAGPGIVSAALASEQTGFELCEDRSFTVARGFAEWAAIISDPVRIESLEVVMRELAQCGVDAGIGLREQDEAVHFDYDFGLLAGRRVADAPAAGV
jgi:hypothetical protein